MRLVFSDKVSQRSMLKLRFELKREDSVETETDDEARVNKSTNEKANLSMLKVRKGSFVKVFVSDGENIGGQWFLRERQ